MTDYAEYLARKKPRVPDAGFDPPAPRPAAGLRDYQQQVVDRMLLQGRGCVFADCGAGKTRIELEWARAVAEHAASRVLILTPLAVGRQMRAEAAEMGIRIALPHDFVRGPLEIANYQRLHHFDPRDYAGIVLDESSILKDLTGATRQALTEWAADVPFRLAATATPAPNDIMELLTHAQWLGVMTVPEAQGTWMVNDASTAGHSWRLKGHAVADFWKWVRTWASIFRRPSDIGCPDPPRLRPAAVSHCRALLRWRADWRDRPAVRARRAFRAAPCAQAFDARDSAAHRRACGRGAGRAVGDLV